jgi:hypothetical protein
LDDTVIPPFSTYTPPLVMVNPPLLTFNPPDLILTPPATARCPEPIFTPKYVKIFIKASIRYIHDYLQIGYLGHRFERKHHLI